MSQQAIIAAVLEAGRNAAQAITDSPDPGNTLVEYARTLAPLGAIGLAAQALAPLISDYSYSDLLTLDSPAFDSDLLFGAVEGSSYIPDDAKAAAAMIKAYLESGEASDEELAAYSAFGATVEGQSMPGGVQAPPARSSRSRKLDGKRVSKERHELAYCLKSGQLRRAMTDLGMTFYRVPLNTWRNDPQMNLVRRKIEQNRKLTRLARGYAS